jgi:hypothetical protein
LQNRDAPHLIWVEEVIKPQLDEKLRYQILSNLFKLWVKQQVEVLVYKDRLKMPLDESKGIALQS